MNDDMPWVNLTQEEVEELRNKKHELTEYGKQKLRELMNKDLIFYTNGKETSRMPAPTLETLTLGTKAPEIKLEIEKTMDCEPYPDEMFDEAERREAERKALDAVEKLYKENGEALKQLAEIEKEEREKLAAAFKQGADGNWYRPSCPPITI